ncbi:PilZ domain-containing protein [Dethiosulfatarculus sandiegensis]|uniref:PilZ domain-containing protein n=1 Tax=Dethiosulfatarculus sandiegensis TaxID=1429043 RepID=A0A0D2HYL1_9BACT|nr:PilZ domain-containing protein [Dethiosulfatarculus sandiegensis]KIX15393.1 hypothetical protein X474_03480 [Dethiosulfatarculus sandiegensis]
MNPDEPNTREYFRTKARLSVQYGPYTSQAAEAMMLDEQVWNIQSDIEHRAKTIMDEGAHPESLKPFIDVARWLDFKLDLILHRLRTQEIKKLLPHQVFSFDISGSGVSLEKGPGLEPEKELILAITLPDAPGRPVYARGQVLRTQKDALEKHPCAAVQFSQISETDRERLIHYTFRQQRRELARRAGEADR